MKKFILLASFVIGMTFVSTAQNHYIGEEWGGGVVFFVSDNGQHGLIAATQDQGTGFFNDAFQQVNNSAYHNDAGKAYSDWRLPNRSELELMYPKMGSIGGFSIYTTYFWSSEELDEYTGWVYMFDNGGSWYNVDKTERKYNIRAIRDF